MKYLILAAFRNRRDKTLSFAHDVFSSQLADGDSVRILLFDDGSSDGTAEALKSRFPQIEVVAGDGSYFWNGAMTKLVQMAMTENNCDVIVMANDDIRLQPNSLKRFFSIFETSNSTRPTAVVGSFQDSSGRVSYSGYKRLSRARPLSLQLVEPSTSPVPCDTFNGNLVAIPLGAFKKVGGIDGRFQHSFGDIDLGYRLAKAGVDLVVAPGYIGTCEPNMPFRDRIRGKPLSARYALIFGPMRSMADYSHFTKTHTPASSWLRVSLEYARRLKTILWP